MKLVIASDHAGFSLKENVRINLAPAGHEVVDPGTHKVEPGDDYPDFAETVSEAIKSGIAPRRIFSISEPGNVFASPDPKTLIFNLDSLKLSR